MTYTKKTQTLWFLLGKPIKTTQKITPNVMVIYYFIIGGTNFNQKSIKIVC